MDLIMVEGARVLLFVCGFDDHRWRYWEEKSSNE